MDRKRSVADGFSLSRDNVVLLIVDLQEKLMAAMQMRDKVVENIGHLVVLSKMLDLPILLTEQYPKGLGRTVAELRSVLPEYEPIEKAAFDPCEESDFLAALKEHREKTFLLTGVETHICILQAAIGMLKRGINVHVVRDATCSRFERDWKMGIEFMRDAGATVTGTETVLFQILKRAGTPEFKAISRRIK